jgi:hypothetical protein
VIKPTKLFKEVTSVAATATQSGKGHAAAADTVRRGMPGRGEEERASADSRVGARR